MANYNKVLLMGNLTRDIELKHTPSGQVVGNIGLAVNRRYKTNEGEQREETTFVDCEAWGRTAEVMNQYLSKGRPVFIEGRLKLDTWQDKDGSNRRRIPVRRFQGWWWRSRLRQLLRGCCGVKQPASADFR
ncbi:MAG TPA: single-stranded DNA-binding protein [Phycisphaerales bacterium]|nr:single-stranded DNA-binding protein [Phycisphaerales bacterium]